MHDLQAQCNTQIGGLVNVDFAGNWDQKKTVTDPNTAWSRYGYIIQLMGFPFIWKFQLQTEIALLSCKSEYTGLSYACHKAIPIMELL